MRLQATAAFARSRHERGQTLGLTVPSRGTSVLTPFSRFIGGRALASLAAVAVILLAAFVSSASAAQPGAETTGSLVRTTTTALIEGRVNPRGEATSYHFEFGTVGPCSSSPCDASVPVPAGAGETLVLVAERLTDLVAGTTYHYRVVADNGNPGEQTYGQDMTVTTRQGPLVLSHGAFPGPPSSDRAWEQVNAPDTGGHSVSELKGVSLDGNKVLYNVKGGTPTSSFGGIYTPLYASRSSNGWQSLNITGVQREEPGGFKGWEFIASDNQLTTMVGKNARTVGGSFWRLFPGAESQRLPVPAISADPAPDTFAIAENGSRVVMRPEGETENLYDVSSETATIVSLLPDGTVPSCGILGQTGGAYGMPEAPLADERWVSANGDLAFFASRGDDCAGQSQLYVRNIPAGETTLLSTPPLSGPVCSPAFIKSTATSAYFWSVSRLTSDDPDAPGACGTVNGDVFRFDMSSGSLQCLTCGFSGSAEVDISLSESGAGITAVGVADDDSRIYFKSNASLVDGAPSPGIYRLALGNRDLRYVAPGASVFVGERASSYEAMTPDGAVIAFKSFEPAINPIGGLTNGETGQYYLYDDRSTALTCVSCPQDGSVPTARAPLSAAEGGGLLTALSNLAMGANLSPLSADGSVFAFATATPLASEDQNTSPLAPVTGTDAYEWRDGQMVLVSDGLTKWPESFESAPGAPKIAGVSSSGTDIYFTAAARLTPDATETAPRLYDARIGGGFNFPPEAKPCPLEVCQGTPTPPPSQPLPGSSSFDGPANPTPNRKHKKKHKKKHDNRNKKSKKKRGAKTSQATSTGRTLR